MPTLATSCVIPTAGTLCMARLHWETPELPGIPVLTLCTTLDAIIAELPEAERAERERLEDLWHQQGVYVDTIDAQGFLHCSWPRGWHLAKIPVRGLRGAEASVTSGAN